MPIFGQYQGGDSFNVAQNMDAVIKQQGQTQQAMLDAVDKFNKTREEMDSLKATTGAILSQYKIGEDGMPDDSAPKYVHDLFKSVNKEGGVGNLSKSQLQAGIQAYQTGFGLQQQQQQFKANELSNQFNQIKLDELQRQIDDAKKLRDATNATEAERAKVGNTKSVTTTETVNYTTPTEKVSLTKEELSPLLAKLSTAKTPEEATAIKDEIGKLVHGKTSAGSKSEDQYLNGHGENDEEIVSGENPNYKEYVSPYTVKGGQKGSLEKGKLDAFISNELKNWQSSDEAKKDAAHAIIDRAKLTPELTDKLKTALVNRQDARLGATISTRGGVKNKLNEEMVRAQQGPLQELAKVNAQIEAYSKGQTYNPSGRNVRQLDTPEAVKARFDEVEGLKKQKSTLEAKLKNIADTYTAQSTEKSPEQLLAGNLNKGYESATSQPAKPYMVGDFTAGGEAAQREEQVVKEVRRSVQEQTDDEYNIMMNFFKAHGGVPSTFTKESFYASKGIVNPTVIQMAGGHTYYRVGGVEKIEKDVTAPILSVSAQETLMKAKMTAEQRNLNGVSFNGYQLSGELKTGPTDIDTANKVRTDIAKSTKAMSNVERLIDIANDASLLEKLTPSEVQGVAESLTNAIQSASRTEIGGSGAWSNKDQEYIDKIVRDPTELKNAIFKDKTLASLKAYRQKLEQGMNDHANVYGYSFKKAPQGGGNLDGQLQKFRVAFQSYMAQGMSKEEALASARRFLETNTQ